jgi:hypothetical protein
LAASLFFLTLAGPQTSSASITVFGINVKTKSREGGEEPPVFNSLHIDEAGTTKNTQDSAEICAFALSAPNLGTLSVLLPYAEDDATSGQ